MVELKPCPFCGGKAVLDHSSGLTLSLSMSYIRCNKCGAKTRMFAISTAESSDRQAAEAWNRRVKDEGE